MRQAGILMAVSSLPSKHGIGDFGQGTEEWLRRMKESGFSIWQILPLNPMGRGNSPYQPYASSVGDPIYINLDRLYEEGFLKIRPPYFRVFATRVDYPAVRAFKEPILRRAAKEFLRQKCGEYCQEYMAFRRSSAIRSYALYTARKKSYGGREWMEWPDGAREDREGKETSREERLNMEIETVLQFFFRKQWDRIRKLASDLGIRIMGDIPFYVGQDSVEVWQNPEDFLLDEDGYATSVAGVPPDYFSETGQRWGNPVYNWEHLENTGFAFWNQRIEDSLSLYDLLRIDHFRAFDTYWKIPSSCLTAIDGEWKEAPGDAFLRQFFEKHPQAEIVAEDLGEMRPEVYELRDRYHLKGMRVLEFSMGDESFDRENLITYTGTHDNRPALLWYREDEELRKKTDAELLKAGIPKGPVAKRICEYALNAKSEYVILPLQDLLGIGKGGRMNTPGTVGSPNWEWRIRSFFPVKRRKKEWLDMLRRSGR